MSGPAGQDKRKKIGFKNNGFAVLLQDSKAVSTSYIRMYMLRARENERDKLGCYEDRKELDIVHLLMNDRTLLK